MDNLYISASFARHTIKSKNEVKIHGVTRIVDRGIPKCILQTEYQNIKIADENKNKINVVVLEGDSIVKDLVAISFDDSKSVYFLSTVMSKIKWITVKK